MHIKQNNEKINKERRYIIIGLLSSVFLFKHHIFTIKYPMKGFKRLVISIIWNTLKLIKWLFIGKK